MARSEHPKKRKTLAFMKMYASNSLSTSPAFTYDYKEETIPRVERGSTADV